MADIIPTVDLELVVSSDDTDNDLVFENRNLTTVSGKALVAQRLKVVLQLFKGEWFLDANAGIPWYQEILEKGVPITVIDAILRAKIIETTDVNRLITYSSSIDAETRVMSVAFTVDTTFGPVDFEGTLV